VRKGAKYERSLRMLELAARHPQMEAKSSLMLGLGETCDEVEDVMRDLRAVGVKRLALGQYLRPTRYHLPVREYIEPTLFAAYEQTATELGFSWVKAGAMVRSSYHAEE
jgi:lipoic acid synthetase